MKKIIAALILAASVLPTHAAIEKKTVAAIALVDNEAYVYFIEPMQTACMWGVVFIKSSIASTAGLQAYQMMLSAQQQKKPLTISYVVDPVGICEMDYAIIES